MLRYLTHPYDIELELVEVVHELPWRLKIATPAERTSYGYRWHCEHTDRRGMYDGVFMEENDALNYLHERTMQRREKAKAEYEAYDRQASQLLNRMTTDRMQAS